MDDSIYIELTDSARDFPGRNCLSNLLALLLYYIIWFWDLQFNVKDIFEMSSFLASTNFYGIGIFNQSTY